MTPSIRTALAVGIAAGLILPAGASAAGPLPTLLAKGTSPTGAKLAKRVSLSQLDRTQFRVMGRPSAASVTLGWPAKKPCALSTYTLSLVPGSASAADTAIAALPSADRSGTTSVAAQLADGTVTPALGAWRLSSTISDSTKLRVKGVALRPLADRYGVLAEGLVRLDLTTRTVGNDYRCATVNRFRVGPGIENVIVTAAV